MSDKGWVKEGELWGKFAADGSLMVWHPSMGGNYHTNHCHISSDLTTCNYPHFKPSRDALKKLKAELESR